ncbi:hypothetical protein ABBQ38_013386 [Trebouxia sp. C0009 RCD-2024]
MGKYSTGGVTAFRCRSGPSDTIPVTAFAHNRQMLPQSSLLTHDLSFELLEQILKQCDSGTAARLAMSNKRLYTSQRSTFSDWRLQHYLTSCFTLQLIPTTTDRGVYRVDYDSDYMCKRESQREYLHAYLVATISPQAEFEVIQHARRLSSDMLMKGLGLTDTIAAGLLEDLLRKACRTARNEDTVTGVKLFVVCRMSLDQLFVSEGEGAKAAETGGRQRQADAGSSTCLNGDGWELFMHRFLKGIEAIMHHAFASNGYFVSSLDRSLVRASHFDFRRLRQSLLPPNGHHAVRVEVRVNFRDSTDTEHQPHYEGWLFPDGYRRRDSECKISWHVLRKFSRCSPIQHYFHIPHNTW